MLKLSLKRTHFSLKELPDPTELPDFTLITGLNGSGKTHLLEAIGNGAVVIEGFTQDQIRRCSWSDMRPADEGTFSNNVLGDERRQLYAAVSEIRNPRSIKLIEAARSIGVPSHLLGNVPVLASLSEADLATFGAAPDHATLEPVGQAYSALQDAVKALSKFIVDRLSDEQKSDVLLIAKNVGKSVAALTEDDFALSITPNWGKASVFQQNFGRMFVQYMELQKTNKLKRADGMPHLSDEEFNQRYMRPPWEFVNEAFRDAGLGFEINQPDPHEAKPFLPRLTKLSSGDEVSFAALSSGERIIMSLALVLYQALDTRQFTSYPRILLLDEVDAPLHPSMSRYLLRIITKTLVETNDVKVIATTHSPSTVAVAPESAVYRMIADHPGVFKASKAEALNLLTDGVPTLAISFDGRRQVFVESNTDAQRYSLLYQLLKTKLPAGRSLEFIATGKKGSSGTEINTGCGVVEHVVTSLVESGNQTVFGLLDWDLATKPTSRVFVLAEGSRYAIENVLLDPLPLAALLLRTKPPRFWLSRLPELSRITYLDLQTCDQATLQAVVDELQTEVLGASTEQLVGVNYEGGFTLQVRPSFLRKQGHDLQDLIIKKFPELRAHRDLLMAVIDSVLTDNVDLLPTEVGKVFTALLEAAVHLSPVAPSMP